MSLPRDPTPVGITDPLLYEPCTSPVVGRVAFGPNPPDSSPVYGPLNLMRPHQFMADAPQTAEESEASIRQVALTLKFLKYHPDAQAARGRSKDRSTQVGAVVLDDDFNVRISGYNGMPRGINDNVEARHQRPAKYLWASHAEENCVAQAARVGVSLKGCTILLTSLFPCTTCARLIIQAGIIRVLAPSTNVGGTDPTSRANWDEQARVSNEMLAEAGVEVIYYSEGDLK